MAELELYLEIINSIIGIFIFVLSVFIYKSVRDNPEMVKYYFFLAEGMMAKPFLFFVAGMFVWGLRESLKVLEIRELIEIGLLYEFSEFISVILIMIGMLYFYSITRKKTNDLEKFDKDRDILE